VIYEFHNSLCEEIIMDKRILATAILAILFASMAVCALPKTAYSLSAPTLTISFSPQLVYGGTVVTCTVQVSGGSQGETITWSKNDSSGSFSQTSTTISASGSSTTTFTSPTPITDPVAINITAIYTAQSAPANSTTKTLLTLPASANVDYNSDKKMGFDDIVAFVNGYINFFQGPSVYNATYDLNGNGRMDFGDVSNFITDYLLGASAIVINGN